ncbi:hypothetical protein PV08_01556 [Exophiala spinifera]|uniref:MARVEL domain-containing protein n=1 Tax=Exophiala spinifera TaxID=91928 RepID=A0A0D2A880_9EURO|nr:uncharacterized protein PV08_01556 [Exophiala spinifera]KIW20977.1 hypothetical protein PV08_01556 [Exophiala spinifera]
MPRRTDATTSVANDYGTRPGQLDRAHRLFTLLNHWLHWSSAIIVMSIAAYFISAYHDNTHLVYWVTIGAVDALLYLPALFLPYTRRYKGYLAPLAWFFSYLWLTAFIFSSQDYNFNHGNRGNCDKSPSGVNKCGLKKTLESFAFIAL